MFVVIEGLDRTGKTTLAQRLQSRNRFLEYVHFNKPEQHPLDEYVKPLDAPYLPHTVYDRYHWGETVWPHVFKRPTDFTEEMQYYTELALESRGAVMVLTKREPEEIARACAEDGEDMQGLKQIKLAQNLFNLNAVHSSLPVLDYEHGDSLLGIEAAARERHYRAATLIEDTPRWVGHLHPNVLLVGDQVGPGSNGWTLPFVPYRNTSGYLLMSELVRESPLDRYAGDDGTCLRPALVNSRRPDGSVEAVASLWRDLGTPPVVALGRNADCVLNGLEVPHNSVPHPQWWRRFNRKAGDGAYVAAIKEAAGL